MDLAYHHLETIWQKTTRSGSSRTAQDRLTWCSLLATTWHYGCPMMMMMMTDERNEGEEGGGWAGQCHVVLRECRGLWKTTLQMTVECYLRKEDEMWWQPWTCKRELNRNRKKEWPKFRRDVMQKTWKKVEYREKKQNIKNAEMQNTELKTANKKKI